MPTERQLTNGPLNSDLDNNANFSADGRYLVFDTRDASGIPASRQVGVVDIRTGATRTVYRQPEGLAGVAATSFIGNTEIVAIHCLESGIPYDFTVRGGMIIPVDGRAPHWLDSRDVTPPFTPGALRGGTHKHEPDASGQWVGFTYNDHIMKFGQGSDLRNVGVSRRGTRVLVDSDPAGANFVGESFTVLLTACVDNPEPGSDQIMRAEFDCWVGARGYPVGNRHQRARAFRGTVIVYEQGQRVPYTDVFVVDVPDDITQPGPLGPLQGTEFTYPRPPLGAVTRRLTHTAAASDPALRGVAGHVRCDASGRHVVYQAKARRGADVEDQVFVVSPTDGAIRQVTDVPGGVGTFFRISPDGEWVAVAHKDGSVWRHAIGHDAARQVAPCGTNLPTNLVISPDSRVVAYNRSVQGLLQVFIAEAR